MSEISYLRHFSAQVSQMVFLAYLTVLRLITTIWVEKAENSSLLPFQCTSITNCVLSLFDHFTTFYNCKSGNLRKLVTPPILDWQKTHLSSILVHKFKIRVLSLFDHFTNFLQTVWAEISENS